MTTGHDATDTAITGTDADRASEGGGPPRMTTRRLLFVAVATMVTNAASYVIAMVAARALDRPHFGAFGALLGLSIIMSTLALAAQAIAARRVAVVEPENRSAVLARIMRTAVTSATVLAAAGVVLAPLGARLLDTTSVAFAANAFGVAALVVGFAACGGMQGRMDDIRFGVSYATLGVLRALGTIIALLLVPTATSAFVGMFAGSLVGAAVAVVATGDGLRIGASDHGVRTELLRNLNALVALYGLINMDVVLARGFLTSAQSAEYAVGAVVAKIAFFLPGFVIYALFARMAVDEGGATRRLAMIATVSLGALVTLVTVAVPGLIIRIVAGNGYEDLTDRLWVFALQGSLFATIQALLYVRFAREDRGSALLLWGALAAFVAIVSVRHDGLTQVVVASVMVSLVVILAAALVQRPRRGMPASTSA